MTLTIAEAKLLPKFEKSRWEDIKIFRRNDPPGLRTCKTCRQLLPLDDFYKTMRTWFSECKDCYNKRKQERWRNDDEWRDKQLELIKRTYADLRSRSLIYLGGDPPKCSKCGFSDWRALEIDHIHGGGNKEHKTTSWSKFYNQILISTKAEAAQKYQVLCANCNSIKVWENNERIRTDD